MKVLLASAELAPLARVGGMAEAVAGLVRQLRHDGIEVLVALPDYDPPSSSSIDDVVALPGPEWAGPLTVRSAVVDDLGEVLLVGAPGLAKPHPYNDGDGQAFPDNDARFFAFSAGVAALVDREQPDLLHLNDWHTGAVLGLLADPPPSVLTIHTLAYQGIAGGQWLDRLVNQPELFAWYGDTNPLLGAIQLADRVITVSRSYANDIVAEPDGMGLHDHLAKLGDRLIGVINGIDTEVWNPSSDPLIAANYSAENPRPKSRNRAQLLESVGLPAGGPAGPTIGVVTRLVEQKGIDLVVEAARFLANLPAKMVILGSGDAHYVAALEQLAACDPGRVAFVNDFDAALSHRIFAGSDLLLMPSRFEPCGLAQMQAMIYGTIPIVTAVGGLRDTVIDDDAYPGVGNGFVSSTVDGAGIVDALHRAVRAWNSTRRRAAIRQRAMEADWSWAGPAAGYRAIYDDLLARA